MSDELLTVAEAAAKLKLHEVTLRNMLRSGQIRGVKVGTRAWRIPDRAIQELIDASKPKKRKRV